MHRLMLPMIFLAFVVIFTTLSSNLGVLITILVFGASITTQMIQMTFEDAKKNNQHLWVLMSISKQMKKLSRQNKEKNKMKRDNDEDQDDEELSEPEGRVSDVE